MFARLGFKTNVLRWRKNTVAGGMKNFESMYKWVLFVAVIAATVDVTCSELGVKV
jgi:hypothetical protein